MNDEDTPAKILIVDDQPADLDILIQTLEPIGYEIFLARNGGDALKTAPRVMPDLILLDVVMPGIDGFEVCRRLKQNPLTKEIPVIFLTVKDEVVLGFQAGSVDYITKPFQGFFKTARFGGEDTLTLFLMQILPVDVKRTGGSSELSVGTKIATSSFIEFC